MIGKHQRHAMPTGPQCWHCYEAREPLFLVVGACGPMALCGPCRDRRNASIRRVFGAGPEAVVIGMDA